MPGEDEQDELLVETPEDDAPEVEAVEAVEPDSEDDDGEVIIAFDGEEPIASAAKPDDNSVMRDMRKRVRELAAENARYKAAQEAAPLVLQDEVVGPVPTLEECDWDENKLAQAIEARAERKAQIERNNAARQDAAARQAAADAAEAAEYVKSRSSLGARDYEDAEAEFVAAVPNPAFQRLIVRAADNPAAVIYALYKSPARLAELAAITDAAKMAAAVGKLESRLKVTKTVSKVQPEKRVVGGAPVSTGGVERHLAKLEAEAERTGDRTKIYQFKREQQRKAAAR